MKTQINAKTSDRGKVISVFILFAISIIIVLSGASFSIYSFLNHVNFKVLNSTVPGLIFGLVITFLGVRYFMAVKKLKIEVFKKSSKFSWSNFKKQRSKLIKSR